MYPIIIDNFIFEKFTAEVSNKILLDECLKLYKDSMQKTLKEVTHSDDSELLKVHENAKQESLFQVCNSNYQFEHGTATGFFIFSDTV